jgi:hypothetical protein
MSETESIQETQNQDEIADIEPDKTVLCLSYKNGVLGGALYKPQRELLLMIPDTLLSSPGHTIEISIEYLNIVQSQTDASHVLLPSNVDLRQCLNNWDMIELRPNSEFKVDSALRRLHGLNLSMATQSLFINSVLKPLENPVAVGAIGCLILHTQGNQFEIKYLDIWNMFTFILIKCRSP